MSSSPDTARMIGERTSSLGLTDKLSNLSPRATISPCTLVLAGARISRATDTLEPTATADLPRIQVNMQLLPEDATASLSESTDIKALRVLGEGGMGRVFLARQRSLGRDVALKTLKTDEESPVLAQGLLHEARITGALEHPGIVPVHALGLDEAGMPILVMKRIEGVSLRILLDDAMHPIWKTFSAGGEDRLEMSLQILMRVCESLSFAHSRGVIHRDIKPDNIMVGAYGEVYLCDWGVATWLDELPVEDRAFVGTPAYMAPEMFFGQNEDARTDVYLLGATLHDILTGEPRHEGASMQQILQSVADSEPVVYDAKVPAELGDLCNRATSTNLELRPASADAFRKELAAHLRRHSATVLCDAALERMQALESALTGLDAEKLPQDLPVVYRNATEARFGFVQSLRVEPSLEAAKNGLQRTLVALFDVELRQKHLESAMALLEEMANPPEALRARLSAARKNAAQEREEADRLRAIGREFDPAVEARPRILGIGVAVTATFVIVNATSRKEDLDNITNEKLVWLGAFLMLASFVVFGAMRKRLGTTSFNRRIVAFVLVETVFIFINRLLGWIDGHSVPTIVGNDVVLIAAMVTVVTITLERRFAVLVGLFAAVRVAIQLFPEKTGVLFTFAGFASVALFVWIWKAPLQRKTGEEAKA